MARAAKAAYIMGTASAESFQLSEGLLFFVRRRVVARSLGV